MDRKMDPRKMEVKIQLIKKAAKELNQMAENFPAVSRNTLRILASVKMLELNISDALDP